MSVYLVTWDLNKEKTNYTQARERFISGFNSFNPEVNWDTALDSVRFISTNLSAAAVYNHLRTFMDANDRIMVTRIYRDSLISYGYLSIPLWDWISARY